MAKHSGGSVVAAVRAAITPVVESLGYSIWDLEYVKEGADYFLRITIDSPNGITIDDCETVHRAIDPVLDDADPIESAYHLEVSSPGIERDLRTDEHFVASVGEKAELRLFAPLDGAKVYVGTLLGLDEDGNVLLDAGNGEKCIPRSAISAARTLFDFDAEN
ncbi:MAG: ribosome maturation factor RimP [Ruminococcaceae bacterium]|nr:ribosome maturation factor RimP [Oscillospiraceae bacterium]